MNITYEDFRANSEVSYLAGQMVMTNIHQVEQWDIVVNLFSDSIMYLYKAICFAYGEGCEKKTTDLHDALLSLGSGYGRLYESKNYPELKRLLFDWSEDSFNMRLRCNWPYKLTTAEYKTLTSDMQRVITDLVSKLPAKKEVGNTCPLECAYYNMGDRVCTKGTTYKSAGCKFKPFL